MGDDFGLRGVGGESVGGEDGAVVRRVRRPEVGRHRQRVVEVRERRAGIARAGGENRLGGGSNCDVEIGRSWRIVFDRIDRIIRILALCALCVLCGKILSRPVNPANPVNPVYCSGNELL